MLDQSYARFEREEVIAAAEATIEMTMNSVWLHITGILETTQLYLVRPKFGGLATESLEVDKHYLLNQIPDEIPTSWSFDLHVIEPWLKKNFPKYYLRDRRSLSLGQGHSFAIKIRGYLEHYKETVRRAKALKKLATAGSDPLFLSTSDVDFLF